MRGRRPNLEKSAEWYIAIPESLAARIELALLNPITGAPRHGSRSSLIVTLLTTWVEQNRSPEEKMEAVVRQGASHINLLERRLQRALARVAVLEQELQRRSVEDNNRLAGGDTQASDREASPVESVGRGSDPSPDQGRDGGL